MTINSITKKDGEVLTVGDETNKGKIKFFHDFMGQIWVAFHETPQQFKADDVSKKGVGDGWVWTDELVREFCFENGTSYRGPDNDIKTHIEIGVEDFKKKQSTPPKEENKRDWEIVEMVHPKTKERVGDGSSFDNDLIGQKILGNMKEWKIHSVRRLSDGEVFSIGDEIGYDDGNKRSTKCWKIGHFHLRETDGVLLVRSNDFAYEEIFDKWLFKNGKPQENKERIEVVDCEFDIDEKWVKVYFSIEPILPSWKYQSIKKAIEAVLNDETSKP